MTSSGRNLRRWWAAALLCATTMLPLPFAGEAAVAWGGLITFEHARIVIDTAGAENPRLRCFCLAPSERNLLNLDRSAPFAPGMRASATETTSLKVLCIRVDFPTEEPDDSSTTGNGRFDLRDTLAFLAEEGHNLDSAPHNRNYFLAHLRALERYWNTVSNGRLSFDPMSTVFPIGVDSAYTLPEDLAYYGTQVVDDSLVIIDRLRQFVVDAVTAASVADQAVQYSDYDAVIIFHAGADGQSDVANNTPNDLFSGFLRLGETLMLRGGTDSLVEAIIMPETEIQDGRLTLLNGVMAHEFGHQLGLVDLYNTNFASPFAFATQIGNFSLMDNNGSNLGVEAEVAGRTRIIFGALPVFPDAWSRAYLGFVDVADATGSRPISVWVGENLETNPARSQVWRVPISETEYYLLENRQFDLDGDLSGGLRQDTLTGVILGPAVPAQLPGLPPAFSREYDFLLPGRGLLIWQVDEEVAAGDFVPDDDILNNFLANTLQWDHDRRFIRLLEADGMQQLGGSGINRIYTGTAGDYYPSGGNNGLSETSNPRSRSYTGGVTGVQLSDIRDIISRVDLSVTINGRLSGFPVFTGVENGDAGALTVANLIPNGPGWRVADGGDPVVFAGYKHYILGWKWDGAPLTGAERIDSTLAFDTTAVVRSLRPLAAGNPMDGGWLSAPLIYSPASQNPSVVAVARNGRVYCWRLRDNDGDSLLDFGFVAQASNTPTGPPAIWSRTGSAEPRNLFVPVRGGTYDLFDLESGSRVVTEAEGVIVGVAGDGPENAVGVLRQDDGWRIGRIGDSPVSTVVDADSLTGPVLGDLDRADGDGLETVVLDPNGTLWVFDTAFTSLDGFPVDLGFRPSASPILADVDRDGYLDIAVVGDGALHVYARNGVLLPNFPAVLGRLDSPDTAPATPVAADFGDPDLLTISTGGADRMIHAVRGNGAHVEGLPRPVGAEVTSSAAWAYDSTSQKAAVFARAADGFLYALEVSPPGGEPFGPVWTMSGRDMRHTAMIPVDDLAPVGTPGSFFDTERAFVYPNPANDEAIVRYWLGAEADVQIAIYDLVGSRVAEWSGVGEGGVYNEWTWPCGDVASGVYFARLEVTPRDGGSPETVFCKMSVVQ